MKNNIEQIIFPSKLSLLNSDITIFNKFIYTKSEEKCFHYEIILPKNWKPVEVIDDDFKKGLIARFIPQDVSKTHIDIYVNHLWREFSPNEWIENGLLSLGHKIVFRKDAYGIVGGVSDFLTQKYEPDNASYFIRTTMAKDHNRLFRVECWAEDSEYPQLAEDFLIALSSFKLTSPENIPTAENLTDFQDIVPVIWGFKYPNSWEVIKETLSSQETKTRLDNIYEGNCVGRIYIYIAEKKYKNSQLLAKDFFKRQEKAGIFANELKFEMQPELPEFSNVFASVNTGRTNNRMNFELRSHYYSNDEINIFIGLVGPNRNDASDWWAVNKRCLEIIEQTMFSI